MFKNLKKALVDVPECPDCGPLPVIHWQNFLNIFFNSAMFRVRAPYALLSRLEELMINFFLGVGLISLESDLDRKKISLRTMVFIDEARKRGMAFLALRGPVGFLNYFYMEVGGRWYLIEGLPRIEWLNSGETDSIDDKSFVKRKLKKSGFAVPEGRAFGFWNKGRAMKYAGELGFPLVVKPAIGSMSQHITVNVKSGDELKKAIRRAVRYSPRFIVERYLADARVFRATVIDEKDVACVERVPAHVIGDGTGSIRELLEVKNKDPRRGRPKQKDTTQYKIVADDTTKKLLSERGYDWDSVPKKDERVYLQEKVILDLGADLFERTSEIHPDNVELFKTVARLFKTKLVGIDLLAEDISMSWREQNASIIELNSLPYVDMHHFPTEGAPVNIGGFICDMVEKYYR